jgi:glucokinase
VSTERIVSGPRLVNAYEALRQLGHVPVRALQPQQAAEDGVANRDLQAVQALAMFRAALGTVGRQPGNHPWHPRPHPKLGAFFSRSPYRARFEHKGRYSHHLSEVPTSVVEADNAALRGLATAIAVSAL